MTERDAWSGKWGRGPMHSPPAARWDAISHSPFYGSTGSITLNQPITAMGASPTGLGYRFIARDGGVFDFGVSSIFGSPA